MKKNSGDMYACIQMSNGVPFLIGRTCLFIFVEKK